MNGLLKKKKAGGEEEGQYICCLLQYKTKLLFCFKLKKTYEVMIFTSENKQHKAVLPKRNETSG